MKKHGFTLIEVLVVIAIIMLLVAMVLPVLRQARYAAYKAVCISNMGQMGIALKMYAQDHRDFFPKEEDRAPYSGSYQWAHWGHKISPYLDKVGEQTGYISNKVMWCPNDYDTYVNSWCTNSYAYNTYLSASNSAPRWLPYEYRATTVIIADGKAYFSEWSSGWVNIYYRHDTIRRDNYKGNNRKHGTANALYGDLHVENHKDITVEMMRWY